MPKNSNLPPVADETHAHYRLDNKAGPIEAPNKPVPEKSSPNKFVSDLLNTDEAAAYLRCSQSYLNKLRCSGGGPDFVRLGLRKIVYRRADLDFWIRSRRYESTSQYDLEK